MNAAALLRCPLCGRTCQSLMRSLESGLPECQPSGHRYEAANDNEPLPKIDCRLGPWRMGRCPYPSCEIAGECMAPTSPYSPANDNEPGQSGAPATPCPFPDRVLP